MLREGTITETCDEGVLLLVITTGVTADGVGEVTIDDESTDGDGTCKEDV